MAFQGRGPFFVGGSEGLSPNQVIQQQQMDQARRGRNLQYSQNVREFEERKRRFAENLKHQQEEQSLQAERVYRETHGEAPKEGMSREEMLLESSETTGERKVSDRERILKERKRQKERERKEKIFGLEQDLLENTGKTFEESPETIEDARKRYVDIMRDYRKEQQELEEAKDLPREKQIEVVRKHFGDKYAERMKVDPDYKLEDAEDAYHKDRVNARQPTLDRKRKKEELDRIDEEIRSLREFYISAPDEERKDALKDIENLEDRRETLTTDLYGEKEGEASEGGSSSSETPAPASDPQEIPKANRKAARVQALRDNGYEADTDIETLPEAEQQKILATYHEILNRYRQNEGV